jgi:hypothetical protein
MIQKAHKQSVSKNSLPLPWLFVPFRLTTKIEITIMAKRRFLKRILTLRQYLTFRCDEVLWESESLLFFFDQH